MRPKGSYTTLPKEDSIQGLRLKRYTQVVADNGSLIAECMADQYGRVLARYMKNNKMGWTATGICIATNH